MTYILSNSLLFAVIFAFGQQNRLFSDLVSFRNTIAQEAGIPPFMIASNKLLADFSTVR